jgi:hypothetical protein
MSINPLSVSLGLPIAAGAIGSGLKLAQQGFHQMLTAVGGAVNSVPENSEDNKSQPTAIEQLESLASGVRDWLQKHGVRLPYSISVSDQGTDQPPKVAIEGSEKGRIAELLDTHPSLLDQLRNLVRSQGVPTPFGFLGKTAVVTDSASHLQ